MAETEQLVVALEARITQFEKAFNRASNTASRSFSAIENRARQSAAKLETTLNSSVANINRTLGAIGVGIGLNEITRLADGYTKFTNQLKVAGLEGNKLTTTQNKLYAIANKYGVQLEAVGTLYGRNSAAAKELGLTQANQLKIVEATSAALKVNGTSGQEAAGALLQLSQMLGGTVVQAQEYNSLLDGARPLLQAVANGSDRWGGSVAKLTQDVKAGNVPVQEFVQALLKGSNDLIAKAKGMGSTFGQAMTTLQNALSKYIGEMNAAVGATETFAKIVNGVADHFGSIADAAAAAAAVILSQYVPGLARAALSMTAMVATNPFLLLATAIGAATFAIAEFGDQIHPVQGELANLQDYAAVAWQDIKAGAATAASVIEGTFLNAVNLIVQALGGAQISMGDVAEAAKATANFVINAFGLLYDTIVITFTKLPAAIAEKVLDAVNGLIAGVERGLNAVIHGVNAAVEAINSVGDHVGITLSTIGDVQLGRIKNGYAGAGKEAGDAYLDALRAATKDRIGAALETLRKQANEHARERENAPKPKEEPETPGTPANPTKANTTLNAFEKEVQKIRERTALIEAETAARKNATGTYAEQEAAADKARVVQELLNAAQRAGITINDDVKSKIATLADAYSAASEQAKALAKSQEEAAKKAEELEGSSKDAFKGLVKDLLSAKSPAEALLNALSKLSEKLLDMALDQIWENIFGPSRGNNFFSNLAKAFTPSASPAATPSGSSIVQSLASKVQPSTTTTVEQTFAAPVGKVERAALPPVSQIAEGLRGTISPEATTAPTGTATDALTKLASGGQGGDFASALLSAKGHPKAFVNAFYQAGRDAGLNDTQARLMAAQAAHESGSGTSAPGFNYFGIKAGKSWKGDTQRLWTHEEINGKSVRLQDNFRKYGSPEEAIQDRMAFMNRNFAKANNSPDIGSAVANLQHGRFGAYATDSGYAGKLQPYLRDINADLLQQTGRPKETVPPGLDMNSTGSVSKQAEAIQQQIEAQQRLAQQMQATAQATTAMQPPIQNVGQAATQVVPNLGGFGQGVNSLLGPLTQAVPGLGQFGGALQTLIQQLLATPATGGGGLLGSILGLAGGGEIKGPGTSTSDSVPAMLSDGEYVVNAKATKRHRAALEAINSGRMPAFAVGGIVKGSTFAPSTTFAPSMAFHVTGSGNQKQDAALAGMIADQVDRTLTKHKPDGFRRSHAQVLTRQAADMQGAARRNG
jgi:tape measure domain-containing protein